MQPKHMPARALRVAHHVPEACGAHNNARIVLGVVSSDSLQYHNPATNGAHTCMPPRQGMCVCARGE